MVTMTCLGGGLTGSAIRSSRSPCSSHACALEDPTLVRAKRPGEEPRLLQHPLGAGVCRRRRADGLLNQLLEAPDLLRLAPQLIVEAQDLRDKPRTKLERQCCRVAGRGFDAAACAMASRSKTVSRLGGRCSRACSRSYN